MDFEEFDCAGFTAERFGTNPNRFQALLIQLQKAGYIEGLNIVQYIRQPERIFRPVQCHTGQGDLKIQIIRFGFRILILQQAGYEDYRINPCRTVRRRG